MKSDEYSVILLKHKPMHLKKWSLRSREHKRTKAEDAQPSLRQGQHKYSPVAHLQDY